jgi:hypothetical protein
MLPGIDKKRDDGLFAKSFGGLQPVQTLCRCWRCSLARAGANSRVSERLTWLTMWP